MRQRFDNSKLCQSISPIPRVSLSLSLIRHWLLSRLSTYSTVSSSFNDQIKSNSHMYSSSEQPKAQGFTLSLEVEEGRSSWMDLL